MIIYIKQRYYYYRRFEHDIWGLCFLDIATADNPLTFGKGFNSNRYLTNYKSKNNTQDFTPKS